MVSSSEAETLELGSRLNRYLFCSFFLFDEMMKFWKVSKCTCTFLCKEYMCMPYICMYMRYVYNNVHFDLT